MSRKARAAATSDDTFRLPCKLDRRAAATLAEELVRRRGADLILDATETARIETPCLQVLLSAARTWKSDGRTLRLTGITDETAEQLALLGFAADTLLRSTAS